MGSGSDQAPDLVVPFDALGLNPSARGAPSRGAPGGAINNASNITDRSPSLAARGCRDRTRGAELGASVGGDLAVSNSNTDGNRGVGDGFGAFFRRLWRIARGRTNSDSSDSSSNRPVQNEASILLAPPTGGFIASSGAFSPRAESEAINPWRGDGAGAGGGSMSDDGRKQDEAYEGDADGSYLFHDGWGLGEAREIGR